MLDIKVDEHREWVGVAHSQSVGAILVGIPTAARKVKRLRERARSRPLRKWSVVESPLGLSPHLRLAWNRSRVFQICSRLGVL